MMQAMQKTADTGPRGSLEQRACPRNASLHYLHIIKSLTDGSGEVR